MWVRGAAIRPVPPYAVVPREVLEGIEDELAEGTEEAPKPDLDEAFRRFEQTQPALSQRAAQVLSEPLDETALALGYFLTISVWLAFERAFGARLEEVSEERLASAESSISLEEELRASHSEEPLELEDVIGIEQPGVVSFVNDHVEAALEPSEREPRDVDVDDVHEVYRAVLLLTVALSHAVAPASGTRPRELLA
jgi:hypothetical protein